MGRRRGDFLNPVLARPTDGLRDRMNLVLGDCVKALWRGSFSGHGGGEKELLPGIGQAGADGCRAGTGPLSRPKCLRRATK